MKGFKLPRFSKHFGPVESDSAEYEIYEQIRQRTSNPNSRDYPEWGGRGIKLCKRWQVYANFLKDMGRKPPGCSIDRIDNDKGYEPGNCRWATYTEQANNRRKARRKTEVELNDGDRPAS